MSARPLQPRAQSMRRAPTKAEAQVWQLLKKPPFDAWHFRRQVPFGDRYIADFASHRAKLIIEIDGRTHDLEAAGEVARTVWFEGQGYRVVRFSNDVVGEWRVFERVLTDVLHPEA